MIEEKMADRPSVMIADCRPNSRARSYVLQWCSRDGSGTTETKINLCLRRATEANVVDRGRGFHTVSLATSTITRTNWLRKLLKTSGRVSAPLSHAP